MASGGYSSLQSSGFSLQWLLLLQNMSSVVGVHGLSCFVARGIFLNQGLNPCSPALAGRFLSTGLPEKSQDDAFPVNVVLILSSLIFLRHEAGNKHKQGNKQEGMTVPCTVQYLWPKEWLVIKKSLLNLNDFVTGGSARPRGNESISLASGFVWEVTEPCLYWKNSMASRVMASRMISLSLHCVLWSPTPAVYQELGKSPRWCC